MKIYITKNTTTMNIGDGKKVTKMFKMIQPVYSRMLIPSKNRDKSNINVD